MTMNNYFKFPTLRSANYKSEVLELNGLNGYFSGNGFEIFFSVVQTSNSTVLRPGIVIDNHGHHVTQNSIKLLLFRHFLALVDSIYISIASIQNVPYLALFAKLLLIFFILDVSGWVTYLACRKKELTPYKIDEHFQ